MREGEARPRRPLKMATVRDLKAGEWEWEACQVGRKWSAACEKDGTKGGRAEW